jgi:thiamine-monophosphate kinase
MDEFDIIRSCFAPLARSEGAAGLLDDVAEIEIPAGRLIVTTDAIVEGVHFLSDDPIASLAAKLVRVNASDIIAKGGRLQGALLTLVWPRGRSLSDIEAFARRLGEELTIWGGYLLGGDTSATDGPLVLSLTLTGVCGERGPVRRSGARPGDDLWVTGSIGDGWLGLQASIRPDFEVSADDRAWLVSRYREPVPPSPAFADCIARFASGSADVSDGLVADAQRIASSSGVGLVIEGARIPLSDAARRWLAGASLADLGVLATGGDDYQALFTASPGDRTALEASARSLGVRLTLIGAVVETDGVRLKGLEAPVGSGWSHFQS